MSGWKRPAPAIEIKMERDRAMPDAECIYREFYGKIYGYVYSKISNASDVQDLVSSVFLKMLQNLDRFSPERASLSTWIYTIARHTVVDYRRQQ